MKRKPRMKATKTKTEVKRKRVLVLGRPALDAVTGGQHPDPTGGRDPYGCKFDSDACPGTQ